MLQPYHGEGSTIEWLKALSKRNWHSNQLTHFMYPYVSKVSQQEVKDVDQQLLIDNNKSGSWNRIFHFCDPIVSEDVVYLQTISSSSALFIVYRNCCLERCSQTFAKLWKLERWSILEQCFIPFNVNVPTTSCMPLQLQKSLRCCTWINYQVTTFPGYTPVRFIQTELFCYRRTTDFAWTYHSCYGQSLICLVYICREISLSWVLGQ